MCLAASYKEVSWHRNGDHCPCLLKHGQPCLQVNTFRKLVCQHSANIFPTKGTAEFLTNFLNEDNSWNLNHWVWNGIKVKNVRSGDIKYEEFQVWLFYEDIENMKRICPVPGEPPEERDKTTGLQVLAHFPKECHLYKRAGQHFSFT